jgi:putative ABC transport system ATP-binding protein
MANVQTQSENIIHPEQPSETGAIVRVENVSRIYRVGGNEVAAVRELSLGVPSGVFAAMKGRSGSGKTTLLNMLGGLDRPTHGEIYLFGKPITKMSSDELTGLRRHKIGFVFQSFAIMPAFSAIENVELMLRIA